jgi:elongation factor G
MTRETIRGPGAADTVVERHLRMGDKDVLLHARARAKVAPTERGSGTVVKVEPRWLPAGANPTPAQAEAVRLGAHDSLAGGPVEGAPLQDVQVELQEVELFGEGSTPQALRIAASQAVREALQAAGGAVLQPLMSIEVVVPDENLGGVLGDLQARGASISGQESDMGTSTVLGTAPLLSLLGYTTHLRSLTRGRGAFTMEFARFDLA